MLIRADRELRIELKGNLAAMLSAAQNAKRSPETGDLSLQVEMLRGHATVGRAVRGHVSRRVQLMRAEEDEFGCERR